MKLYYSDASPYARKVRVVALEKNIELELVLTDVFAKDSEVYSVNPLGKVPTLVDDGVSYCDSSVIAEYLDWKGKPTPRLMPETEQERLRVLRLDYLALGILDAAVKLTIELRKRPEKLRWDEWKERQELAINGTLNMLEKESSAFTGEIHMHHITLGVALAYLDYRHEYLGWRLGHPQLTSWYEAFAKRPSMAETEPKG